MALSFDIGDTYTLNHAQGGSFNNEIFPPGVYEIEACAAKGGNGSHNQGGKGGRVKVRLILYTDKRLNFLIGLQGQNGGGTLKGYGGSVVNPQGGIPNYSQNKTWPYAWGGNGYVAWPNGAGGGGYTQIILYSIDYARSDTLFTVGGGGGASGITYTNATLGAGEGGGLDYTVSDSYYKVNTGSKRGKDGLSGAISIIRGGGGGGAGDPGGGNKDNFYSDSAHKTLSGSGGFGGRTHCDAKSGSGYKLEVIEKNVGYNNGHGYIIFKYVDYIYYTVNHYKCSSTLEQAREDAWVTCTAYIEYEQYNEQGKLFRCNSAYGIFGYMSCDYVKNVSVNSIGTSVTFQMIRSDAYIHAVFYSYKIVCTNCSYSSDKGDKVLLPGNTYRVKANPEYKKRPFITFVYSEIDEITNNIKFVSRTEFTFVMPEKDVYITAIYLERVNTNMYKDPNLQEPFNYKMLPFKE